jgi:membrane protease YdiL (CAAX protease family)
MSPSRAVPLYFALALVITWGLQLPALLAMHGVIPGTPERYMALVGLGAFGPMAAAMVAAHLEGSGIRALFRPLRRWKVSPLWYATALGLPGGIFVVAALAYDLLGHAERLLYAPDAPAYVLALACFSFGEEMGWRGFALPRLAERHGPVAASVVIGVVWTVWHAPMLALQGVPPVLYAAFFPFMIGGSIAFTWIWRRTGGSLLLCVLAHAGAHLNNPGHALPGRATPMVIHTVAYVLLAVALIALDRGAFTRNAARDLSAP